MQRRAGLYLRISQDREGTGLAVERQREDGLRLIEQRGWVLHREYVDNDISAAGRKRRPEFEQLLADVESRTIDVIVSLSLDRLSRHRREQLHLVEICQEYGTLIAQVRGGDLDLSTAMGRAVADWMAVPARLEIEQKSERHIRQIAQAAEQGRMVGGRRAFGYTPDGLALDPVEAPILRQLYDRWLTGEPLNSMVAWLNEQGVTTPQGNRWRHHSLREVLANPRNCALRGMRDVVNHKTGTRSQWHRIIGPAVWPAIVPEETWRAALDRIKDPTRPGNHVGRSGQRHLLSGIAECGVCGAKLISGNRASERVLRCPSRRHVCRRAVYIEDFVELMVISAFRRPENRALLMPAEEQEADLDAIRSESIELRARLAGLAQDYADGVLDREQMKLAGDRIRGRLADLEQQVVAAGRVDVLAPLRAAEDPETVWDEEYPLTTKREVIRRLMQIRVLPGRPGRPGGQRFQEDTVDIRWLTGS